MKKLLTVFSIIVAITIIGCTTSQRRTTYNTLGSIGYATDSAYSGYLDLVIAHRLPTNNVPIVARDYDAFQAAYGTALFVAQHNTNILASENLIRLSEIVIKDINTAKGLLK